MEEKKLRENLRTIIKYQIEAYNGKINPKDDFNGFIFDIENAILSAGYIKKDEIECDRKKIEGIIIDTLPRLSPNTIGILAENIATHLKSIIK